MKSDVEIRAALPDDAEAIAGVIREAFAPFEKLYTPEAYAYTTPEAEKIRERFNEKGAIWVALKNEKVVGTISVVPEDERLYIRSMAVSPTAQGGGIGRRLLEEVEKYASERGFARLYLYTTPYLKGAIRLYEQNGFEGGEIDTDSFFGTPWFEMTKYL